MTDAQIKLVEDNQRLVRSVLLRGFATRMQYMGEEEDLIQTGMIGLIKAAKTWEPERGIAFSTYAWRCIRTELGIMWRRLHRQSCWTELMPVSLDETYGPSGSIALLDMLPDTTAPSAEVLVDMVMVEAALQEDAMNHNDHGAEFLLRHAQGETLVEIAQSYCTSKQRVQQAEHRARERIKRKLNLATPNEDAPHTRKKETSNHDEPSHGQTTGRAGNRSQEPGNPADWRVYDGSLTAGAGDSRKGTGRG